LACYDRFVRCRQIKICKIRWLNCHGLQAVDGKKLGMALAKISVNKNLYASFMPVNFVFGWYIDTKGTIEYDFYLVKEA